MVASLLALAKSIYYEIIIKAASEVRVQKFCFENEERLTSSMDDGYI